MELIKVHLGMRVINTVGCSQAINGADVPRGSTGEVVGVARGEVHVRFDGVPTNVITSPLFIEAI